MSDIRITLPGSETFTLTGQTIDKLLRVGDGDAALLYLYILKSQGQKTTSEAAKALDISMGRVASAMAVLSRLGLVQLDNFEKNNDAETLQEHSNSLKETSEKGIGTRGIERCGSNEPATKPSDSMSRKPRNEPYMYTEHELSRELRSDSEFPIIVDEAQRKLGKILSPDELKRLLVVYRELRLPPEVILQLITHCINECSSSRSGRTPSVRYIEKAAFTWEREGIFTLERAEEYLKALEVRKSARGKIKNTLQIRNRELSATEKRYVDDWIIMGFQPEVIAIAYDKTVTKTGNLTWPYIDKILKNWHEKNLHTTEQIAKKEGKPRGNTFYNSDKSGAKKHGDPNREEIQRAQRLLNKMKEE
ncbi:MAG: DnaD domain protein [Oscillospiraceae bacterium]|nr:DnaD domain protein [Oscillospiraceae bacterium]